MVPIPLGTPLTEHLVYPPGIPVGNFDGAYKEATVHKSDVYAVELVFRPIRIGHDHTAFKHVDEFVLRVVERSQSAGPAFPEGHPVAAGDAFVLPKGWVGLWDMKTHFKKIIVNF